MSRLRTPLLAGNVAGFASRRGPLAAVAVLLCLAACGAPGGGTVSPPLPPPLASPLVDDLAEFAGRYGMEDLRHVSVRIERARDEDGTSITFEALVAETPAARARGLQGVVDLPDGVGMLFLFPDAPGSNGGRGFWMFETLLPLDIAFADEGTIVGVATMEPCSAQPCPITHPGAPYDMALEVAAAGLTGPGIAPGDRIVIVPR
jgi:uncharacterized membrane protein (UPF0127 family)